MALLMQPLRVGQMRLGHKPVCGLCESNYYLPLRFAPLELEFTIVSDSNEPIVCHKEMLKLIQIQNSWDPNHSCWFRGPKKSTTAPTPQWLACIKAFEVSNEADEKCWQPTFDRLT